MKISFLLPTRGRPENLKLVLDSLENTCDSISNYEVILCLIMMILNTFETMMDEMIEYWMKVLS